MGRVMESHIEDRVKYSYGRVKNSLASFSGSTHTREPGNEGLQEGQGQRQGEKWGQKDRNRRDGDKVTWTGMGT